MLLGIRVIQLSELLVALVVAIPLTLETLAFDDPIDLLKRGK